MEISRLQKNIALLPGLVFLVLVRLLPHPPNTAPIFCAAFALMYFLPKHQVILLSLFAFVLSDIALSLSNAYSAFGFWSFFTYTGFIASLLVGGGLLRQLSLNRLLTALVSSSLLFWIWTNFGTWLATTMYPKTLTGLVACFVAGIPFLSNAMLGQLAWSVVLFVPLMVYRKRTLEAS